MEAITVDVGGLGVDHVGGTVSVTFGAEGHAYVQGDIGIGRGKLNRPHRLRAHFKRCERSGDGWRREHVSVDPLGDDGKTIWTNAGQKKATDTAWLIADAAALAAVLSLDTEEMRANVAVALLADEYRSAVADVQRLTTELRAAKEKTVAIGGRLVDAADAIGQQLGEMDLADMALAAGVDEEHVRAALLIEDADQRKSAFFKQLGMTYKPRRPLAERADELVKMGHAAQRAQASDAERRLRRTLVTSPEGSAEYEAACIALAELRSADQ